MSAKPNRLTDVTSMRILTPGLVPAISASFYLDSVVARLSDGSPFVKTAS